MANGSILVTGASGGIGASIVRLLVERDYRVFAGVRTKAAADALTGRYDSGRVVPLVFDITDERATTQAVSSIYDDTSDDGFFGVVNNAGLIVQGPIELLTTNDFHEQYAVNVFGPMLLVRLLLPLLRATKGRIVNVGAATGRVSVPMLGAIASSKAALASLNDALRIELAPWSVRVSLVEPGAMATQIFSRAAERSARAVETSDPQTAALYASSLNGFAQAMSAQKAADPAVAARAVVHALTSTRPRNRYLVGGDARVLNVLKNLPDGVRDRMMRSSLGLNAKSDASDRTLANA